EDGTFAISAELKALTQGDPLLDASALEVLRTDSGFLVLVTQAGSDRLFVFGPGPTDGQEVQQAPTARLVLEATAGEGAPRAVVVTVLAGGLPEEEAAAPRAGGAAGLGRGFPVGGDNEPAQGPDAPGANGEPVLEGEGEGEDAADAARRLQP